MQNINKNVMTTDMASGLSRPTQLTDWKGQNSKLSAVWPDSTVAQTQINLRMRVVGELQRRNGMAASNVAKQSSAVLGLIPSNGPGSAGIIVIPSDGTVVGSTTGPKVLWRDAIPLIPIGAACNLFPPFNTFGTTSPLGTLDVVFPRSACQGTVFMSGTESVMQGVTFYGYQFIIRFKDQAGNLISTYSGACLINMNTTTVFPAGCVTMSCNITGGCNGGLTPGTWTLGVTTP